jgi:hypothetical protein
MSQELAVSLIPDRHFFQLMDEVEALPLRKRSKWHGFLQSIDGAKRKVHFVDGQLVFKHCSEWIMVKPHSDQYLNEVAFECPVAEAEHNRLNSAYQRGGQEERDAEFERLANEAATGNHRSKPSKIRVPTKAGEPVRA